MILRRDFDFSGKKILDGMIASSVAEFEFIRFRAVRESNHLMSETNTENGNFPFHLFHEFYDGRNVGGVSGTV